MKTNSILLKGIFSISILTGILFLASCGEKTPTPSAAETTTKKLTANGWKISNVQVNGADQTALFKDMTLSFTATNFTTTNGGVVWPATGTWAFTDANAKAFTRSDNVVVTITEITDASLKLSLDWTAGTFGPGRSSSISGGHVFSFVKK